jgi:hypothetical protein
MAVQTTPARRTIGSSRAPMGEPPQRRKAGDPAGRRATDGPTLEQAIGWLLAAVGFLIGSRAISDNSFFTHFATGNQILDSGVVPTTDVFSFTAEGEPWTVQSWFASVWYRAIYDVGGLGALRVANGLLIAGLTATLWRLTRVTTQLLPRVALVGLALTAGTLMWSPRPLIFGLIALALVIEIVENDRRPLWLLVPTMWLWVNTHGSFPLAFVYLGAAGVGHLMDVKRFRSRDLRAGGWLLGATLVGALNPVGVRLLVFPFELLSRQEALADVAEWRPPDFDRPSEWAFLLLAFGLLTAAKLGGSWRQLLPGFGFFVTGLLAVRNINPAVVVMIACAAPGLAALPGSLDGVGRTLVSRAVAVITLAVLLVVAVFAVRTPGIDYDDYPVLEVDWLEARGLVAQPGVNLVHRDTTGNYLELRYGAEARVFMDDRYDMYPQTVIDDHAELYFGGDFAEILARYEADAVLWESNGDFADWLRSDDSGWDVGFSSEDWLVATPGTS